MAWRYIGRELADEEDDGERGRSKDEPGAAIDYAAAVPEAGTGHAHVLLVGRAGTKLFDHPVQVHQVVTLLVYQPFVCLLSNSSGFRILVGSASIVRGSSARNYSF